jgi:hypothetical protein
MTVRAEGQSYSVFLNGEIVTHHVYPGDATRPSRALSGGPGDPRFVGLQAHTGVVSFRDVRLARL